MWLALNPISQVVLPTRMISPGLIFSMAERQAGKNLAEVIQTVGGGLEDHDGDRSASQVLLISKVCVQGDQNVKNSFRKFQEFAVLFSSPARFLNGTTNVTVT